MKFLAPLTAIALAGVTMVAVPAASHATAQDAPVTVTPQIVTANGSGCPADSTGTIALKTDGNRWTATLPYLSMIAAAGADAAPAEFRRNCQLNLKVGVPAGYTYAVKKYTLSGSAYIENGAKGFADVSMYFQGSSATSQKRDPLTGLFAGPFSFSTDVADADLVWASCGASRNLNVNMAARIDKGTQTTDSYSWIRMDEANGLTMEVVTKKC